MRIREASFITILLLLLAALPWVIASCSPVPIFPEELQAERSHYEATVEAFRDAANATRRAEPSTHKVVPVGTVAPSSVITPTATVPTIEVIATPEPDASPVNTPTPVVTQAIQLSDQTTRDSSSAVTITGRTVLTATEPISQTEALTSMVIVVQSDPSEASPTKVRETSDADPAEAGGAPPSPPGLVDLEDVITTQMLAEQISSDASDVPLSELAIDISDRGFNAAAKLTVLPGLSRPVNVKGRFTVENSSLVVKIESIIYDNKDVTTQFRGQVEDRINSSLYRLLPQKYVTSFEVDYGQLVVHSQGRPE